MNFARVLYKRKKLIKKTDLGNCFDAVQVFAHQRPKLEIVLNIFRKVGTGTFFENGIVGAVVEIETLIAATLTGRGQVNVGKASRTQLLHFNVILHLRAITVGDGIFIFNSIR